MHTHVKKLFYKLILLAPSVLLLSSINFFVDPAHQFSAGYENKVAKILLSGRNAVNVDNYDERLLQKHYIAGLRSAPEIIVLGSSRSMQIEKNLFPGKTFFNHSVSGGSIEDYYSIYAMYKNKHTLPSTVILTIDPWVLNRNHGQRRWISVQEFYNSLADAKMGKFKIFYSRLAAVRNKITLLFSPSYLQSSLRALYRTIRIPAKPDMFYASDGVPPEYATKMSDGSLSYPAKEVNPSKEELKKSVLSYTQSEPIYSLGGYHAIDKNYVHQLQHFIDILKTDNVDVIIFLPPYHPFVYDYLIRSDKYSIIGTAEDTVRMIAQKNNLLLLGSYNPSLCGFSGEDLFDGMHSKRCSVVDLFKKHGSAIADAITQQ